MGARVVRWWFELRGGYTPADVASMHIKMHGGPFDRQWMPPLDDPDMTRGERNALSAEMRNWAFAYQTHGEKLWPTNGKPA